MIIGFAGQPTWSRCNAGSSSPAIVRMCVDFGLFGCSNRSTHADRDDTIAWSSLYRLVWVDERSQTVKERRRV